ncbi:hypothetical protein L1987_83722 [Smallanthus sonchifolius]|uniref:Uncharacterized protein n=1 Tax=Smallanthus sonchifolius TaxID=185202 RepID=A0ACB8YC31_9ASTR|nr:hypothetical protein L1987_83722 [Smallanthus sonchifolius]
MKLEVLPHLQPFLAEGASSKGDTISFRAFSHQKYDLVVHPRESRGGAPETTQFRSVATKMIESLKTKVDIVEFIYDGNCAESYLQIQFAYSATRHNAMGNLHITK